MMFEEDLRSYLLTVTSLTSIVGAQIFGVRRPQGDRPLPEILIQRAHTLRQVLFCGTDSLVNADFQVDSYGIELSQVIALAKAVRLVLKDYKGSMGATHVDQMTLINEFPMDDPDPGVIRMLQIYNVWYSED